jgi:hypothetical protein
MPIYIAVEVQIVPEQAGEPPRIFLPPCGGRVVTDAGRRWAGLEVRGCEADPNNCGHLSPPYPYWKTWKEYCTSTEVRPVRTPPNWGRSTGRYGKRCGRLHLLRRADQGGGQQTEVHLGSAGFTARVEQAMVRRLRAG